MSAIKDFIDIYKQGGAACLCVDYLREKYNIGFKGQNKALQATLLASMDKVLPEVEKGAETAIKIDFRELQEEIESSLLSYGDKQGKENYCYRLLQPFGLLNDFIRIKIPTGMVKNIEQRIKDLEKEKALQKALSDEEKECYGREIDRCKQEIKDLESNRDEAFTLFQTFPYKEGDFEDSYRAFLHCFKQFTITLDWVLMCNKIDLLELQEQSGIYIISGRCKADYLEIAGSVKRADDVIKNFKPQNSFIPDVGQKKKPFDECLISKDQDQQEKVRQVLKTLGQGKKGKGIAIIVKAAMTLGYITQPTYEQAKDLWGSTMGSATGYNRQMGLYKDNPIDGDVKAVMQAIKQALK